MKMVYEIFLNHFLKFNGLLVTIMTERYMMLIFIGFFKTYALGGIIIFFIHECLGSYHKDRELYMDLLLKDIILFDLE